MVGRVIILGGGISGLSLGYELLKRNIKVEIIEKSDQLGGLAKTINWKGYKVDMGPHIYHSPDSDIVEYFNREFPDLFYERDHWAKNYRDGEYFDYPISEEYVSSLPNKIRNQIETELKQVDKNKLAQANNYNEYIKELAGPTLQEMFFIRYPEKLWGMKTTELDANWAPKRIQIREKSTPFYFGQWAAVGIEGSSSIIEKLGEKVRSIGGVIKLNEEVSNITINKDFISKITSTERTLRVESDTVVVNTLSFNVFSSLSGLSSALEYRGVALVLLEVDTDQVFPSGVDFLYIDDTDILFTRLSDQNSFLKNKVIGKTVICAEVPFSKGDLIDSMPDYSLSEKCAHQFSTLSFGKNKKVIDSKVIRLPEVYPMYTKGYRDRLSSAKDRFDSVRNLYTHGSLAEFVYADLQILFSKSIDLAAVLSEKTFSVNKILKNSAPIKFKKEVKIFDSYVGEGNPCFVIAEIGLNHNGDLNIAKRLIDEAINAKADAVKLQSYKSGIRVVKDGKTSRYVEKVLGIEETDFEMFEKNELSKEQTKELFQYADGRIPIFSAPFDTESVDELLDLNVSCFKIASFDIVNLPLLEAVGKTNLPILLSTGMSTLSEVEDALRVIASTGNEKVILLQCTSVYPCPPESMNIKAMDTMRAAFGGLPVGLSDHVIGEVVALAAVARGANILEKHFTLDKKMEGPDHVLSLEPYELKKLIQNVRLLEDSIGTGVKEPAAVEYPTLIRFRKTMYFSKALKAGNVITKSDITYKGPAFGIYAKYQDIVIGSILVKDVSCDQAVTWDLLRT